MAKQHGTAPPTLRAVPSAIDDRTAAPGHYLLGMLLADIAAGTASLPSPRPRIAGRIRRGIEQAAHGRRVARLLSADPALSAKLLRAACDAAPIGRPRTLPQVVERLDRRYLVALVTASIEAAPPFDSTRGLRQASRGIWRQALRVSAIAYLLAILDGRFDPEEAALAGLLHNLGELALFGRATREHRPGIGAELAAARRLHAAEAGRELARSWGFPRSLTQVAGNFRHWERDHAGPADMADLVLVAQLHGLLGHSHGEPLPALRHVPAFDRLDLGRASPRFSLGLLEAARNALALTERQLAAL